MRVKESSEDKPSIKKERQSLSMLVGENLFQLSHMPFMDLEFYKSSLMKQVFDVIIECNDKVSQLYLVDILLSTFPASFHVATINYFVECVNKLN